MNQLLREEEGGKEKVTHLLRSHCRAAERLPGCLSAVDEGNSAASFSPLDYFPSAAAGWWGVVHPAEH